MKLPGKKKHQMQLLLRLTSRDAAPEGHQVRPESPHPPTYPVRLGRGSFLKTMPSENGFPMTWKSGTLLNQKPNKQTSHE